MRLLKTLMFCAAATVAGSSTATELTASNILSQFNAVVTGKFKSGHDVEGRIAVDELVTGATFYNNPSKTDSDYVAINAVKIDKFSANINNGGSVAYQSSDAAHFNFNGGGSAKQVPSFSMDDFTVPLNALTEQLAGMSANSTINSKDWNNFTFLETADATGTAVFSLTTDLLSTARNLVFSGTASTIIINVTGTSFTSNTNFNANDYLNSHIIWNFIDATTLSFQGWHGTVLAGEASVTNSSAMEGTLYAANYTGNGELHDRPFAGTLPVSAVPEAATYGMLLPGLALIGWVAARRKKRIV
jgi:choice-of-anchor A domain-containing protein